VLLILVGAVADLAEAMDEDSPRQAVACFALVEFPAGLTAQFRIPQPVEGEQRAFQPPQLAQRRGEAVLPRVGGELAPSTWHLQIVGKRDGLSDARRCA